MPEWNPGLKKEDFTYIGELREDLIHFARVYTTKVTPRMVKISIGLRTAELEDVTLSDIMQVPMVFNMVHYFNAIGRGKISFWLAVVRQIVFNIPIMLILNYRYGAYGLVWTQLIADVCTVVVSYVVYFMVTRKMK